MNHPKIMRPSSLARPLGLAFLLIAAVAHAELAVIYDNGNTRSINDYIKPPKLSLPAPIPDIETLSQDYLKKLFPVHTQQLSPGTEPSRHVNLNMFQPIFILGTDALSIQWLTQYRDRLTQIGAVGLVAEVQSMEDFKNLQDLANGLPLSPVNVSEVVGQLKINHYPVLITSQRVEQ